MIILDPDGLFNGDRIRACSNEAQLHFHRLLLISNGYGRLELNYLKIIGAAYSTFRPPPSEPEIFSWVQQYVDHHLLFPYQAEGQFWGQWDIAPRLLPRYRTAKDRRSPKPPEPQLSDWKQRYLSDKATFPKFSENFQQISAKFPLAVAVADVVAVVKQQQQQALTPISKTEWPETTAAVQGRFESADGMFVLRLVQDSVQAAISVGLEAAELTDRRLAGIIKDSIEENFQGKGRGPGLLLKTVPQIIKTRAERNRQCR